MALCPKCSENFIEGRGVISRKDNKTEICPECGYKESVEEYQKHYAVEKTNKIIIEDILDELQIHIDLQGYRLWISFVEEYLKDETKSMEEYYFELAKKHNKTRHQVERCLRHAYKNNEHIFRKIFGIEYVLTNKAVLMLLVRELERRSNNASKVS